MDVDLYGLICIYGDNGFWGSDYVFSGFFWTSLEQISTKNEDLMGIFGSKIGLAA